ncbi:response regulator transcription factor [Lacticaseibacillus parakribbianus]|uniref:response regulator transcription factor n=1 Tax=Lacticaseibacillus parakribbianus TaxID=2970927 RepID=UPI0021CB5A2B|nr:response regulator transcription factor [Lacticaseibacillus parakribbianus]
MATILIVEDNPDIQALLKDVLTPEYDLQQVTDGSQALPLLRDSQVDLVILDLMLPGVSGESILTTLRRSAATPVLVLTAIQDKAHIAAVLEAGANDYLTKPFDIDELIARVHVQLRTIETALSVAGLRLDPQTYALTSDGQPVALPKKEFELLTVLMQHPHQVFQKAALYQQVWQEPYLNAENTLNVHLSHLRNKLSTPQHSYITAVWGIGVRLL